MIGNSLIRQLVKQARRISPQRACVVTMGTNTPISYIKEEKNSYQDLLPSIKDSLASNPKFSQIPEAGSWVKQILDYNLIGGNLSQGLTIVILYERLEKAQNITEDSMRRARTLGWCFDMLLGYFNVFDDIIDGSTERNGLPCWHRVDNVNLGAIMDGILINSSIYETLRMNFSTLPLYSNIVQVFNEATLITNLGQKLDYKMSTAHRNKKDYSLFTLERYYSIIKHKCSYIAFNLPILLSCLLTNHDVTALHWKVNAVCEKLGYFIQIQDDYLDSYGDLSTAGKIGTDIQEGKCSWTAVSALKLCNEHQRSVFVQNYGDKDPAKVETIKRLYDELRIPEVYQQTQADMYDDILQIVKDLPDNDLKLDSKLLDTILYIWGLDPRSAEKLSAFSKF